MSCQNRQEISDFDMRDFTVVIANMVSVRGKGRIVDSKLHYFLDGTDSGMVFVEFVKIYAYDPKILQLIVLKEVE